MRKFNKSEITGYIMKGLRNKLVFVILDGAADRRCKGLQDRTPYETAFKPNLDYFAENGKTGLIYTVKKGVAPESDVAVLALLGYDPYQWFIGRGSLEAFGADIPLRRGDLALRANFSTVKDGKIIDRRVGRTLTTESANLLANEINKRVKLDFPFIFKPTIEHRGILVIRGSFSDNITNTDPAYSNKSVSVKAARSAFVQMSRALDDDEASSMSANLINSFSDQSHNILKNSRVNLDRIKNGLLPANYILMRDAGTELPNVPKLHGKWLSIAGMPLEIGISKLVGMQVARFNYPDMKTYDVYDHLYLALKQYIDFAKKVIEKNIDQFDNFYLHIKETDVPGHDGMELHKKKMIEIVDERLFSYLRKLGVRVCVTSDHATPCCMKNHSDDPVPVVIYGYGKGRGNVKRFDENSAKKGEIGAIKGTDLMKYLL